jgi:uncharacterized protein YigE (DUF2233 family)
MLRILAALIFFFGLAVGAQADCRSQAGNTVCEFDPKKDKIALFNLDAFGQPFGGFGPLSQELAGQGQELVFAMNAGMFGTDLKPIGLYVQGGKQIHKLNRAAGPGNFHMKPNGVFYIASGKAGVMETDAFAKSGIKPDLATQSGPMLVVNGAIHPKISASGTSAKLRNGVCVNDAGKIDFVISDRLVTFYDFAAFFLDDLGCKNALFLDGSVSSLYAPEIGRSDFLARIGPIVGVVK